jgi:hypothetical protein
VSGDVRANYLAGICLRKLAKGRRYYSSVLKTPVFPIVYAVAFGFAILCLVYLFEVFENGTKVSRVSRWGGWLTLLASIAIIFFVCSMIVLNGVSLLKIEPVTAGVIGIVVLVVLLFSNMSLGMVMAIVGFLGMSYITGSQPGLASIGSSPYSTVSSYSFSVVPLFVLMGAFCFFSGLSRDLYFAVYKWIGHFPGGLAMAPDLPQSAVPVWLPWPHWAQ